MWVWPPIRERVIRMGVKKPRKISPIVQHVIHRITSEFDNDDRLLSRRICNEYSREFVTKLLNGDEQALQELGDAAKQKRWINPRRDDEIQRALQHIRIVRIVSSSWQRD